MAKQLFSGEWKPGEVFEHQGKWYVAEHSMYLNATEMEDGFDIFINHSGLHTEAHEAVSAEDQQLVQAHLAQVQAKHEAFEKHQREVMFAGTFSVGQRVFYKNVPAWHGTVTEIAANGMVRVLRDGKKAAGWIEPGVIQAL